MSRSGRRRWCVGAWLLSLLALAAWGERLAHTGLALRVEAEDASLIASYGHADLGTTRIDALPAREARPARADWTGYWNVPRPGFSELVLKSDGEASVRIDGVDVLGIGGNQTRNHRAAGRVPAGLHRLHVVYRPGSGPGHEIFLKGITEEGRSIAVERRDTFSGLPSAGDLIMGWMARLLPAGALLTWVVYLALRIREGSPRDLTRKVPALLICLVTLLAAGLRFEAVVIRYGGAAAPDWADALAGEIKAWRPGSFEHTPAVHPYEGDPFSYLTIARSMGGFYEPSAREPLFPYLTRLALALAGGRDIGINFLSALCSALACISIFALGSRLLSPWTGVAAAFLWAIEWQALSFSVEGWRDDLFTLQVAACAAALISLHLQPGRLGAVVLGVAGGLTLLTRLSALTFLVPGLVAAVLLPSPATRRDRLGASGIALLWMGLLAGPFMAACAIGFGDPFYAVNVHAAFYRGRAGLEGSGGSTALQFLAQSLLPWEFLQTGFVGLTSYPFLNKWRGLGALLPGLGEVVRALALAGLPVLLRRPGGGVALLVLFSSIAPYAWTWGIPGGGEWRFTLPAYPFYLVSAVLALETGVLGLIEFVDRRTRRGVLESALRFAVTAALLVASGVWVSRSLQWHRVSQAVGRGRPTLIEAGSMSGFLFPSGWTEVKSVDGSTVFSMSESEARLRIPLSEGVGARIVLRLGSTQGPTSPVEVFVGDERLVLLSGSRGQGETATLDVTPRPGRPKGVLELRFVGLVRPNNSPLTVLWVRVEPEGRND